MISASIFRNGWSGIRRDFHMHPETAFEEVRTTEKIAAVFTESGLEVRRFEDRPEWWAYCGQERGGHTVGLRADIDALKLQELTDVSSKFRTDGKMHACGHDAHMTMMLGVAKHLVESGPGRALPGNVKFFFQPAEEDGAGANKMIGHGVLEDPEVDAIMAGHAARDGVGSHWDI